MRVILRFSITLICLQKLLKNQIYQKSKCECVKILLQEYKRKYFENQTCKHFQHLFISSFSVKRSNRLSSEILLFKKNRSQYLSEVCACGSSIHFYLTTRAILNFFNYTPKAFLFCFRLESKNFFLMIHFNTSLTFNKHKHIHLMVAFTHHNGVALSYIGRLHNQGV